MKLDGIKQHFYFILKVCIINLRGEERINQGVRRNAYPWGEAFLKSSNNLWNHFSSS
jgi:hypothetical protein